jgi:hypothetical protein
LVLVRYWLISVLKLTKGGFALPVTITPREPPGDVGGYNRPVILLTSAEELMYERRPRLSIVLWSDRVLTYPADPSPVTVDLFCATSPTDVLRSVGELMYLEEPRPATVL